ncbi:trypsin-like peptidase domain-containing protein [Streptomyces spinosisporus]|uniref:Trypsin-like peptidase domain-containing protein n=1 Tax=Streptomyces spinosisporus TaxID=2927582 RepID=A0ABS9XLN5_9ACTN|nr:trypsin-like peptidase domain-containing protein [Streptomyces spinosisporus]MCI3242975.1 trypsin-like peptidase domain-containing protein [Streptomyces spinosisporus]
MNEGKPTKPKWWNRPRRPGSLGDGDYELERPVSAGERDSGEPGSGESAPDGDSGGDFELRSPHEVAAPEVSPVPDRSDRSDQPGRPGPDGGEGDFVLDSPAPQPAAERPKPLHDPDPYSTPPYGEPGPWAPAPPVQHPATTPAAGTAIPTPPPAPAPAPPQAHAMPTPAPQAPAPHGSAPQAPAPHSPVPQAPAPHVAPPPAPAAVAPGPTAPPTPWQNYDPWSSTPLQQNGAAVESKDKRRRRVRRALVGGAVALALVSGGVGGVIGAQLERNGGIGAVELPQAGKEPAGRAPDSVAGIAARALPSVVTLHVTGAEESGTGTGFVLDPQGHILTNNHVVEPAADSTGQISVTFNSGDTAKATVVGRDSGYDLAVVKVGHVRGLKPMPLGNSDNVQVGDPVVAIGAPFDLEGTVTSGIISAKERPITAGGDSADGSDVSYVDALQTDAPINPGNSGGPLLDSAARVIGINSAIRSADEGPDSGSGQAGSIGLGFAIPVNQAKRVAEELINTGKATHPVIGVTLDMNYTGDGARVGTKAEGGGPAVTAGGPGEKAGLKAGDVITAVDGQRVHSGEELIVKTRAHRPGDHLELTVRRDGKERRISLVLGSSDGDR